jgi:hypothetical protein
MAGPLDSLPAFPSNQASQSDLAYQAALRNQAVDAAKVPTPVNPGFVTRGPGTPIVNAPQVPIFGPDTPVPPVSAGFVPRYNAQAFAPPAAANAAVPTAASGSPITVNNPGAVNPAGTIIAPPDVNSAENVARRAAVPTGGFQPSGAIDTQSSPERAQAALGVPPQALSTTPAAYNPGFQLSNPAGAIANGFNAQQQRADENVQRAIDYISGGSSIFERATRGRAISGIYQSALGPNNEGAVSGQGADAFNSANAGIEQSAISGTASNINAGIGANASIYDTGVNADTSAANSRRTVAATLQDSQLREGGINARFAQTPQASGQTPFKDPVTGLTLPLTTYSLPGQAIPNALPQRQVGSLHTSGGVTKRWNGTSFEDVK